MPAVTNYRRSRARRVGDVVVGRLIWTGLVPNGYLLTTIGRRTGKARTRPVAVVVHEGRRWLVSRTSTPPRTPRSNGSSPRRHGIRCSS